MFYDAFRNLIISFKASLQSSPPIRIPSKDLTRLSAT
ncbi:unnamed protein product [Acanthoscelides obtectus]|uniref:Uncharacterized protein n=1 Tax=Acanthoscelides obtectus TaxID=200917 RepID=A0A9P0KN00_ACAOB|nr:unnamed protein product [Acanthoscelides obtectus]CAK1627620.1 hypothetical protein AOBTE_LOCUS4712 [Acanthoscelides obtectus]